MIFFCSPLIKYKFAFWSYLLFDLLYSCYYILVVRNVTLLHVFMYFIFQFLFKLCMYWICFFMKNGINTQNNTNYFLFYLNVSEPIPMRLRALPQSFWQQPNTVNSASPGSMYSVLPPLCKMEQSNSDLAGKVP